MPYCPLKMLASRLTQGLAPKSGMLPMLNSPGSYDAGDECDKEACGFWSAPSKTCGIAASVNAPLQAVPPEKEDDAAKPLVGNVTTG